MFPLLLLAFIIVPIAELVVIGQVSARIGLGFTLALLLVDSLIGAVLIRREGRRAWRAFRRALEEVRWPGDEVAQGALVLVGGALLLTPGFLTDVVGLLAVLPPTRALASRLLRRWVVARTVGSGGLWAKRPERSRSPDEEAIDVEIVSVERNPPSEEPDDNRGGS